MKSTSIFLINMVIFSAMTMLNAQVNLDSGLVAFYPFTGNSNDESVNGNDGVVMGAILSSDRNGTDSSAYEFDGTASYITIPNSPTLQSPDTALSQVAWINIYSWSLVGTSFGPIIMKSNSGNNAFQYRLSVGTTGVNTALNNWTNAVINPDTLNFNEWYMIASVFESDSIKHYVNGAFIGSGAINGPITPDNLPLEIGRDVPGSTEIFHGKIDDIRIYNRALTFQEIQELYGISTGTDEDPSMKPIHFQLHQNYPNPFNPTTSIAFDLPKSSQVTLKVFNILGEEVATLVSQQLPAGSYSYEWDGSNVASGIYLYRLETEGYLQTRKMILMK